MTIAGEKIHFLVQVNINSLSSFVKKVCPAERKKSTIILKHDNTEGEEPFVS